MSFVLSIMVIFVIVSIYFFFRAEKLQRELIIAKRERVAIDKENRNLNDAFAQIANRYQGFSKDRLQQLSQQDTPKINEDYLRKITPLINNYGIIFSECIKGKGRMQSIVKKCYNNEHDGAFKDFTLFIKSTDTQTKRMWSSNNLSGFISLVEALLNNASK